MWAAGEWSPSSRRRCLVLPCGTARRGSVSPDAWCYIPGQPAGAPLGVAARGATASGAATATARPRTVRSERPGAECSRRSTGGARRRRRLTRRGSGHRLGTRVGGAPRARDGSGAPQAARAPSREQTGSGRATRGAPAPHSLWPPAAGGAPHQRSRTIPVTAGPRRAWHPQRARRHAITLVGEAPWRAASIRSCAADCVARAGAPRGAVSQVA